MQERRVTFKSDGLKLEGLVAVPDGATGAGVVCHPHPLYGGSMHNNVVEAVLEAMWTIKRATLRFNFRGVGASEGDYDGGAGEARDALAAVAWLASHADAGERGVLLAGYSFGAAVAMRVGMDARSVERLIAIALPLAMTEVEVSGRKPVLLISGDRDAYSPVDRVQALASRLGAAAEVRIVAGADHFFGGFEAELSREIAAALSGKA
jgi:hypothetical protein